MKLKELIKLTDSDTTVVQLYNQTDEFGKSILTYSGDGNMLADSIKEREIQAIRHTSKGLNIILEEEKQYE